MRLTYATRRSALALAQCRAFCRDLQAAIPGLELVELQVVTSGDRVQDRPLSEVGGKGLFVKEIEEALLGRRANFAVHSMKDVPAFLPDGLEIACTPKREDPRDALVSPKWRTLAELPNGTKVGTSSLRRGYALKAVRPDLEILPIRGNVDTRLRKVDAGEYDAIVLAVAGLNRLGLADRVTERLDLSVCLPAVGQGALGIECRRDDARTRGVLLEMQDPDTSVCVAAERGVLESLEGDCKTPIAAYANRYGDALRLDAILYDSAGKPKRSGATVSWPTESEARVIGREIGLRLKDR